MAEREGFEPPIALRLCLISSQVHSTGLCHLSALFSAIYSLLPFGSILTPVLAPQPIYGGGSMLRRKVRVAHCHLLGPMPYVPPQRTDRHQLFPADWRTYGLDRAT